MPENIIFAFFGLPGGLEWIIIGLVALLLFGRRLPEVARSLGQAFHEFKNGLAGKDMLNSKPEATEADPQHKPPQSKKSKTVKKDSDNSQPDS